MSSIKRTDFSANVILFWVSASIFQSCEMLINEGDNVLIDKPTYPGTLAAVSLDLRLILTF